MLVGALRRMSSNFYAGPRVPRNAGHLIHYIVSVQLQPNDRSVGTDCLADFNRRRTLVHRGSAAQAQCFSKGAGPAVQWPPERLVCPAAGLV